MIASTMITLSEAPPEKPTPWGAIVFVAIVTVAVFANLIRVFRAPPEKFVPLRDRSPAYILWHGWHWAVLFGLIVTSIVKYLRGR